MGEDEYDGGHDFNIGDIVRESALIIPPDRAVWVGTVMYIERKHYELHSFLGPLEDLIGVQWFQEGYIESLPASVLRLVQRANKKTKRKP